MLKDPHLFRNLEKQMSSTRDQTLQHVLTASMGTHVLVGDRTPLDGHRIVTGQWRRQACRLHKAPKPLAPIEHIRVSTTHSIDA